jgi:hypothetical protein
MSVIYFATKPQDLSKINSRDFGELLWWSYNLNVTLEKLVTTIEEVGDDTKEVIKYLENND